MTTAAATKPLQPTTASLSHTTEIQTDDKQLHLLTAIAWQISYSALWNGKEFSPAEISAAKEKIRLFISQGQPQKTYSEYVQRVMLARQYIITHERAYAPHPTRWLHTNNKNGFAGTERWFRSVEEARAKEPAFKQYIKALPEAVLETLQSDKAADFHYWRSWFALHDAQSTLNLFLSVLANCWGHSAGAGWRV